MKVWFKKWLIFVKSILTSKFCLTVPASRTGSGGTCCSHPWNSLYHTTSSQENQVHIPGRCFGGLLLSPRSSSCLPIFLFDFNALIQQLDFRPGGMWKAELLEKSIVIHTEIAQGCRLPRLSDDFLKSCISLIDSHIHGPVSCSHLRRK